jgi:2-hydroxycyclohexanecarboxyl-CoA dehydrogenase
MKRLEDRIALITGGGGGIGRATCQRLAQEGARVVAADLDLAAAEETAAVVGQDGGTALAVQMDITDFDQVRDAVAGLRERWGPVDCLVNNAGWDRMEFFIHNTPDFWSKVIDVNLRGPIHCSRAVLDDMTERNSGKIVFISSDAGRVGSSGETVYATCKGGVIAFAKSLAREFSRNRINVNVVCPGPTDTALWQGMVDASEKITDALVRAVPFRRLARPDEIAAAVAFFASPDSDFITGQVLSVSGGLTMAG